MKESDQVSRKQQLTSSVFFHCSFHFSLGCIVFPPSFPSSVCCDYEEAAVLHRQLHNRERERPCARTRTACNTSWMMRHKRKVATTKNKKGAVFCRLLVFFLYSFLSFLFVPPPSPSPPNFILCVHAELLGCEM